MADRIRHVKCDERTPDCFNCVSTGRKCDGYKPSATSAQQTISTARNRQRDSETISPWNDLQVIAAPILGLPSSGQSRRMYHSFVHSVVPSLAESLEAEFWRT